MGGVAVIGVGMTKFGKFPDRSVEDLGREACWNAIQDAGINPREIQAAFCGHIYQGSVTGQRVLVELGLTGIPIYNIENACASSSSGMELGCLGILAGQWDVVLAFGAEKLYGKIQGAIAPDESDLEGDLGIVAPGFWAMRARRHMHQYGTTSEMLAQVSVQNRRNACLNPYAQFRKPVTVEEVLASRLIADPLHLLDCCPIGDGAAAAILVSERVVRRYAARPIWVAGIAVSSGTVDSGTSDSTFEDLTERAAQQAYHRAGIGPRDVDVAELHNCFTIAEIVRSESLGLVPRGEGGRWVAEGNTAIGGEIPINPSGGLLAKGHPVGATGIAQVAEIAWQLRGEAGDRQVEGARVGLTHNRGGIVGGTEGGACCVTILKR
jgi:benzoylsuccinyl-CoA thiolase BbsB subunit